MVRDKTIELFKNTKKLIFPNIFWKIIYSINPNYLNRKKQRMIGELKTIIKYENDYFEEAISILIDLLKKDNHINEVIYYYNYCIKYYKSMRNKTNMILVYKLLINTILECDSIYFIDNERDNMLVQTYIDFSDILFENVQSIEAIKYLEEAMKLCYKICSYSVLENICLKLATIYIDINEYKKALIFLDDTIKYKPRYSFSRRDMKIIILYILLLLAMDSTCLEVRKQLDFLRKTYTNIYECEEYLFIINMISSVENSDVNHFTHEIHNIKFKKEEVYTKLFIDIHKNILLSSRITHYSI